MTTAVLLVMGDRCVRPRRRLLVEPDEHVGAPAEGPSPPVVEASRAGRVAMGITTRG